MLERLGALQMHLNPVREKAALIKTVKSDAFWVNLTVEKLEEVRKPLRAIMRYRERTSGPAVPPKIIDVTETASEVHHLYSRIPFYRLPEVIRDHRELAESQRLTIRESLATVRLHLWDEARGRLMSFSEARARYGRI